MIELVCSSRIEDQIKIFFDTIRIVRSVPDKPTIWKLDLNNLDLLCEYMHIVSHERLFEEKFLDASIDMTSTENPGCAGTKGFYPLIRF